MIHIHEYLYRASYRLLSPYIKTEMLGNNACYTLVIFNFIVLIIRMHLCQLNMQIKYFKPVSTQRIIRYCDINTVQSHIPKGLPEYSAYYCALLFLCDGSASWTCFISFALFVQFALYPMFTGDTDEKDAHFIVYFISGKVCSKIILSCLDICGQWHGVREESWSAVVFRLY